MYYRFLLIFFIATVFSPITQAQERVAYRVEVIILRLVQAEFPPEPAPELRDYTGSMDLGKLVGERQQWLSEWAATDPVAAFGIDLDPPLTIEAAHNILPDGITYIPELGEQMSGVRRNLRLSAEYRPEVYLSWEQDAQGEFPAFRLHNGEIILVEDDYSEQRIELRAPESGEPRPVQKIFTYDAETGVFGLAPVPEPRIHYAVDGTIRMRRSRFLHIDLDLEYRYPTPATLAGLSGIPLALKYQGYHTHPLRQSRQIRTGRMEYFDSPVLGALVWVTAIEAVATEADEEVLQ